MLGQIVAFFAVATSVAFASTCGYCYPGYGGYCGGSVLGAGLYNNGLYGSRIMTTAGATPPFIATVGAPEVISSCGNSLATPVLSTGIMSSGLMGGCYGSTYGLGYGSALGRCGTGLVTAC